MSQSDSLLVEDRSRYSVLVIDGDQLSGCHALEALRGMGVTWVTSLEDANAVLNEKDFDFILSSASAAEERCGKQCMLAGEIIKLAFRHNSPLCFIYTSDFEGNDTGSPDHLTFRAASKDNLADNMLMIQRNGFKDGLLSKMKCTCTYTMPGRERSPEIWLRGLEMLQAMCMGPKVVLKPPKTDGQRQTKVPRK